MVQATRGTILLRSVAACPLGLPGTAACMLLMQMDPTPIKPPVSVKAGPPEKADRIARFVVTIMTCLGALGLAALLFFPLYFAK